MESSSPLEAFRESHIPIDHKVVTWKSGKLEFEVDTYVTLDIPPLDLVTSVRCIVLGDCDTVLLVTDTTGERHILPGGRREPGETLETTLVRELIEETGFHITPTGYIGALVFTHRLARPSNYKYPYPTFIQSVLVGSAASKISDVIEDEWVTGSRFAPISEVVDYVDLSQKRLMQAAMAAFSGVRP